jgi:hypothetical protein
MTNSPADGPGSVWTLARFGSTWVRQEPKRTGAELFAWDVAASGDASTILIGDPSEDSFAGAAFTTAPTPTPANSFSTGELTTTPHGWLLQQLSVSAAATVRVRATVSVCALARRRPRKQTAGCARRRTLYGSSSASIAGPGVTTLRIRPSARARFAIAKRRTLGLRLTATMTPRLGASPAAQSKTVILEGGRGGGF